MHRPNRRGNRGPAAAPDNHRAILDAARRLFAERGYHVPLSAIAREAGVGQGVLYRHFPTRLDLAFTVFEENLAELEALAAQPGAETFTRLWRRLVELTVEDAAFLEMVADSRRSLLDYDGAARLLALIDDPLRRAREAGLVRAELTGDDVLLAQRMAYGVVATATEEDIEKAVERALALLTPWERPAGGARQPAAGGPE